MATGASDGWRMNRRLSIGSTGATVWSFGPCIVSGPYSCRCTDAHRMFRCPSNGSSGALLTTFSSQIRSGQSYTGDYTDGLFSKPSDFRCLGLAGPPVMFSLNPSAGPRVSLTPVPLPPRKTAACTHARTPCRRRSRAACSPLQAAAAPEALHCAAARARPHLSCAAAPQSLARPRRACTTCAPLTTRPPPSKSYAATCSASTHTPTLVQPPLLRLSLPRSSIQD